MLRGSAGLPAIAVLAMSLGSQAAAQQTFQHDCQFSLAVKSDSDGINRYDVDWRVKAARKGKNGQVEVDGSGSYKARAKIFPSGAVEFSFRTDVSLEVLTIGANGEALWTIEFNNSDTLTYVGGCDAARRTG
ncbi:hypothetical protein [Ascidiaceihabitans sp.]|uniref:hypothetical protein n=1 Tax=Ascidiaceihabitans sp. TaxID=1872644 RepID=UPI0032976E8F